MDALLQDDSVDWSLHTYMNLITTQQLTNRYTTLFTMMSVHLVKDNLALLSRSFCPTIELTTFTR
jgi:hypothetical protein